MLIFFYLILATLVSPAQALMRPMFVPAPNPMLILNWEGVSSAGFDAEPREFYDSLASIEKDNPSGGKGKIFGLSDKAFQVTCVQKGERAENILCTIVIKSSLRSKVSIIEQSATVSVTGDEAKYLFEHFAGSKDTYQWLSQSKWLAIVANPNEFEFRFKRNP
jgi:hypothetical protein